MRESPKTNYVELGTGMEIELEWSDDETMVTLSIVRDERDNSIEMSSLELDGLAQFLRSRLT